MRRSSARCRAVSGQLATIDLVIDNPLAVIKCVRGDLDGNGKALALQQVSFSSSHGSQISVTPSRERGVRRLRGA